MVELEILVLALEELVVARHLNHILVPHPLPVLGGIDVAFALGTFQGQISDARLISVPGNAVVRYACRYPYHAFLAFTFANHFHNPYLVRVADGETLSAADVTVLRSE